MSTTLTTPRGLPPGFVPPRAGWFVALGLLFIVLGVVALLDVVAATIVSTIVIGFLVIVAGVGQIAHAVAHRGHAGPGIWLSALIGALYIVGGFIILEEPIAGSVILTAVLAFCLVFAGIARIAFAAGHRHIGGWWAIVFSGLFALLIGAVIYFSLPWSGLWLLGTFVGVELIFAGVSALTFGAALRRHV